METLPFVYAGVVGAGICTNIAVALATRWSALKKWWWKLWGWKFDRLIFSERNFTPFAVLFRTRPSPLFNGYNVQMYRPSDAESEVIQYNDTLIRFPLDTCELRVNSHRIVMVPVFGNNRVVGFEFWTHGERNRALAFEFINRMCNAKSFA